MTEAQGTEPGSGTPSEDREQFALDHVKSALTEETDHSREEVEKAVDEAVREYDDVEIRDFVPILAERDARKNLGR